MGLPWRVLAVVNTRLTALEVSEVDLRGLHLRVAQHTGELKDLASVLEPAARERVAEGVRADTHPADTRTLADALHQLADSIAQEWDSPVSDEHMTLLLAVDQVWAMLMQVLPQRPRGGRA